MIDYSITYVADPAGSNGRLDGPSGVLNEELAPETDPAVRRGVRHGEAPTEGDRRGSGRSVRQNAVVPFGVPRPVGPSHPVPAWHHTVVEHVPLLPDVTSKSPLACPQVYDAG
jgi:hypothetical protein